MESPVLQTVFVGPTGLVLVRGGREGRNEIGVDIEEAKREKGARAMDGKRRTQIQAHLSYDNTAGRTLAQNHRDTQKSRLLT